MSDFSQPLAVTAVPSNFATYFFRAADYVPAATATDVLNIKGAAGKIIYITRISVGGVATAASLYDLYITRRTTANAGGTFTNPVGASADARDPAQSAIVTQYSANPTTLGTGVALDGERLWLPAAATPTGAPGRLVYDFGTRGGKAPTLRSALDSISISFNAQAVPAGASLYLNLEWVEEAA
jgi:hypothetical protein